MFSLALDFLGCPACILAFATSLEPSTLDVEGAFLEGPAVVFLEGLDDLEVDVEGRDTIVSERGVPEGLEEVSISEGWVANRVVFFPKVELKSLLACFQSSLSKFFTMGAGRSIVSVSQAK